MMFIGFSSNKTNLFSKLIRFFTKSKWSHCFLVIQPFEGDCLIAEASFHGGIKFNLLSKYQTEQFDLELVPVETGSLQSVMHLIGANYGWLQIFGALVTRILGLKHNFITKDVVCSEFVFIWLKSQEKTTHSELNPNDVTPEDIYELLTIQK